MYIQSFSGNISGTTHTSKTQVNTAQLLLILVRTGQSASASKPGSSTASHSILPLALLAAHRPPSITAGLSPSAEHEKLLCVSRFSKHARQLPAHWRLQTSKVSEHSIKARNTDSEVRNSSSQGGIYTPGLDKKNIQKKSIYFLLREIPQIQSHTATKTTMQSKHMHRSTPVCQSEQGLLW